MPKNPGNIILNNTIMEKQDGYKNINPTDKVSKNNYILDIISTIHQSGGRFIAPAMSNIPHWRVATPQEAYTSVQRKLKRSKMKKKQPVPIYNIEPPLIPFVKQNNHNEAETDNPPDDEVGGVGTYEPRRSSRIKQQSKTDKQKNPIDSKNKQSSTINRRSSTRIKNKTKSIGKTKQDKGGVLLQTQQHNSMATTTLKSINKFVTIPSKKKKGVSNTITKKTTVKGMVGNSKLSLIPNYLPSKVCDELADAVLSCNHLRQYNRRCYPEPRLHFLLHPDAQFDDMDAAGPGYAYRDVNMKGMPLEVIPGVESVAKQLAKTLDVPSWSLGIDVIVYASGTDGMGYHADNSQGESVIACLILKTDSDERTVVIKPNQAHQQYSSYKLQLGTGSVYVMNGIMQQHYVHSVLKLNGKNKRSNGGQRIVLVFRHGDSLTTIVDNGKIATLGSRLRKRHPVQFGAIDGVEEGHSYFQGDLVSKYAHRSGRRGVNGSIHTGCDAIIICRNCPKLGEVDSEYIHFAIIAFFHSTIHLI